jgi:hypothetical protein
MGCSCAGKRAQFEVVADGGNGRVLFTGTQATAQAVSRRYDGSVVREKGAATTAKAESAAQ